MKYKFCSIRINVTKYDVTSATKGGFNPPLVATPLCLLLLHDKSYTPPPKNESKNLAYTLLARLKRLFCFEPECEKMRYENRFQPYRTINENF